MRSLAFEPEAAEELASAAEWYEGEKSGLGAALLAEVEDVLQGLRSGETAGVVEPHAPTDILMRRVLLRSFPYAVEPPRVSWRLVCVSPAAMAGLLILRWSAELPGPLTLARRDGRALALVALGLPWGLVAGSTCGPRRTAHW